MREEQASMRAYERELRNCVKKLISRSFAKCACMQWHGANEF